MRSEIKLKLSKLSRSGFISRIALALAAVGLILVGAAMVNTAPAQAAVGINKTLNFQGRLLSASGAVVADGNYNMRFKVYQDGPGNVAGDTGGTLMWTELWQNSVASGSSTGVVVKNGYFSVNLGSYCAFAGGSCQGASNTGIDFNQDTLWLSMDVAGTAVSNTPTYDGELLPMRRLASSVYSLQAENANKLGGIAASSYVQLAQGVQADSSTANASIFINKTGTTANIMDLQRGGADVMVINNAGQALFRPQTDSTTALSVQKAGTTTTVFAVDTSNSRVGINTTAPSESLTVNGNFNVRDADTASKAYRFRTSGSALDFEAGGADLYISNWTGADFTGTQRNYLILQSGSNIAQAVGSWQWRTAANGTSRHTIDGTTAADVAFNQDGEATNFSVQGDTDTSLLYVKGSTDRVGIGTNLPGYKLDVAGTANASTSVLTPLLDTASATALNIGTTNATGINLKQNVSVAAGKTLTVPGHSAFGVNAAASATTVVTVDDTLNPTGNTNGISNILRLNPAGSDANYHTGMFNEVQVASGNAQNFTGGLRGASIFAQNNGTGTVAQAWGGEFRVDNTSTGVITDATALKVQSAVNSGGGTITTNYGLNIADQTAGATNYSIYTGLGTVRLGGNVTLNGTTLSGGTTYTATTALQAPLLDTASAVTLNIGTTNASAISLNQSTTLAAGKSLTVTGGNTASRPASPTAGQVYYDSTTNQLLQYNGTKWITDRSTSTKIVAASNSTQAEKDAADYIASGTGDQGTINTALTAAAGGLVYLMEGTYSVTAAISVPNNTTLAGAGAGTLITIPNAQNTTFNMITNTDTTTGTRVTIRDMQLDGNRSGQTNGNMTGIYLDHVGGGSGSTARDGAAITNVWVRNIYGFSSPYGIHLVTCANSRIENNTIVNTGSAIMGDTLSYSSIVGNNTQGAVGGIFLTNSNNDSVTGNTSQGNINENFWIMNSNNIAVTGNSSQGSNVGMYIYTSTNNTISGNSISGATNHGIDIAQTSTNNTVTGNKIYDSGGATANNGVYFSVSSSNNSVTDNDISDTSCTTTCYAINVSDATSAYNYLANNHHTGTSANGSTINDAGAGTIYANQPDGSGNLINKSQGGGLTVGAAAANSSLTLQGAFTSTALPTPAAPTLSLSGLTGGSTYGYKISAVDGLGETLPSTETTTSQGNFTLTSSNKVNISWTPVGGAYQYKIYRSTGAGSSPSTGLIGTVAGNITTFSDTGIAASGSVAASNTTGGASIAGLLQAAASLTVTGTATASLSVQAPSFDTASAGALSVGTTNATSINIGKTGSNIATTITGTAVIKPSAGNDSASAFQLQNAAGQSLFNLDTTTDASNLVTNGSFEAGTTGWALKGNAGIVVSQASSPSLFGSKSLSVTTTATAQDGVKYPVTLTAGTTYNFTFYARIASGTFTNMAFGYSADGSTEATYVNSNNTVNVSGWTRYSINFTPAAVSGSPYLFIKQATGTARTIYVDGVYLTSNASAGVYSQSKLSFDGLITSPLMVQNVSDSQTGVLVQDSAGNSIFAVDTLNDRVGVGTTAPAAKLSVSTSGSTPGLKVLTTGSGDLLDLYSSSTNIVNSVSSTGAALFKNSADSTTAFQIQNAAGTTDLTVDTTTGKLTVNQGGLTINGISNPATPTLATSASGGTLATATYYYRLAAMSGAGETQAIATNPMSVATTGTTSKNTISWSAVTNATGYKLYRSTDAGATWKVNTLGLVTSAVDDGTNFTWGTTGSPSLYANQTGNLNMTSGALINLDSNLNGQLKSTADNNFYQTTLGNYGMSGVVAIQADSFSFQDSTAYNNDFNIANTGAITAKNRVDTSTALQVQKASSETVLKVDTASNRVKIGDDQSAGISTIALVGQATNSALAVSSLTATRTTTSGNLLVLSVGNNSTAGVAPTGVTDTAGNTWVQAGTTYGASLTGSRTDIWYAVNAASVTSVTVTMNSTADTDINLSEYSGVATSNAFDAAVTNVNSATTTNSTGTLAAAANGELLIGNISYNNGVTTTGPGGSWTSLTDVTQGSKSLRTAYQVIGSAGSYSATWTSSANTTSGSVLAGFKPVSGQTATLLVLDNAPTATAPSGINGGMYYDTTLNKFRCYENGAYANCIGGTASGAILQAPTSTATNTITPTTNSVVALTVKGTTGTSANVLEIFDSTATPTRQAFFDATGSLNLAKSIQPTANNTVDIGLSGTQFRSGYFGTSVLSPLLDTASVAGLSIGTNNANYINLMKSTGVTGALTVTGTSGNMVLSSSLDGGDFNIGTSTSGTFAFYGQGGQVLNLNLLDGGLQVASTSVLTNGRALQNITSADISNASQTTGTTLQVTSTNNAAANTSWSADKLNVTNAQGTAAVTGMIAGLDVQFTQNTSVAGNTETVANFAVAANASASTDSSIASILNLSNNDTATGNQITVTDALKINGANVTNGINLSGTFSGNLISSTNFNVTQAGQITAGGSVLTSALDRATAGALTIGASTATSIQVGGATNNMTFASTGEPTLNGTAQHTRQITLSAEYAGATMSADGTNNNGSMTSDNMTSSPFRNYYQWANTQGTAQDYDIWVRVPLPSDFAGLPSGQTICIDTYASATTANGVSVNGLYGTNNSAVTLSTSDLTPTSINTWQNKCTSSITGGTYAANGVMNIDLKLTAPATTGIIRVGDITMSYLSKW